MPPAIIVVPICFAGYGMKNADDTDTTFLYGVRTTTIQYVLYLAVVEYRYRAIFFTLGSGHYRMELREILLWASVGLEKSYVEKFRYCTYSSTRVQYLQYGRLLYSTSFGTVEQRLSKISRTVRYSPLRRLWWDLFREISCGLGV